MLAGLMPEEGRFFVKFNAMAMQILEGCNLFERMVDDFHHIDNYILNIRKKEHECDEITHSAIDLVNKVFITPLDREDIQILIKTLDDII